MMPLLVAAFPVWFAAFLLFGFVTVLVGGVGVAYLYLRPAEAASRTGPSLGAEAEKVLRAQGGAGQVDAEFERIIEGTQLGLSAESAAGWIVLMSAVVATITYIASFDFVLAGSVGIVSGAVVFLVFWSLQNRRRRAIQEQLPDGVFQLARSLRSGLILPAALRETKNYVPEPLAGLFSKLAIALSFGESTRDSVRRVAENVRLTEFDLLAEVLALNAESGGNLPTMLDHLAASMRDRNQFRGYFRTTTTLSRVAAIFLALAAPIAFIFYLILPTQREFMLAFLDAPQGRLLLGVAVGLWLLGIIWVAVLLRRQDDY